MRNASHRSPARRAEGPGVGAYPIR
jgi:hypothetical protein